MSLASESVRRPAASPNRSSAVGDAREWRLAPAWYDLPDLVEPNSLFLKAISARLAAYGLDLTPAPPGQDPMDWNRTLFGQACGYHFATALQGRAKPIAAPCYRTRQAEGPFIRSALLVRAKDPSDGLADLRGRVLAFDPRDLSSQNLLRAEIAPIAGGAPFFASLVNLPSTLRAAQSVADGEADAALIDGVALAHLQRLRSALTGKLRLLSWTSRAPAPPYLTSAKASLQLAAALRSALADAMLDPTLAEVRKALLLEEIVTLPEAHYRALIHFEQLAESQGYPDLR